MRPSEIPQQVRELAAGCEAKLSGRFAEIDAVSAACTERIMEAFQEFRVSEACFAGTTGYGYDDLGRETLDKVWARVFGAEKAIVRIGFVNGTHAIASALFAALRQRSLCSRKGRTAFALAVRYGQGKGGRSGAGSPDAPRPKDDLVSIRSGAKKGCAGTSSPDTPPPRV